MLTKTIKKYLLYIKYILYLIIDFIGQNIYNSKDYLLEEMLNQEELKSVILFHLDESMHDYIAVLTRRIKQAIAADLSACLHTHIYSETAVTSMLIDSLNYTSED